MYDLCTTSKTNGRVIERSEYTEVIDKNKIRIAANPELYRKRQAIVEHPFGVIKRQWGFSYIMTKKGIERASADVGLIFSVYNLRRIFNLIEKNELKEYFKRLFGHFWRFSGHIQTIRTLFFTEGRVTRFSENTTFTH